MREGRRRRQSAKQRARVREMPFLEGWCVSLNVFFTTGSGKHIILDCESRQLVL